MDQSGVMSTIIIVGVIGLWVLWGKWRSAKQERAEKIAIILRTVKDAQQALNKAQQLKTTGAKVSRLEDAMSSLEFLERYPESREVITNFDSLKQKVAAYIKVLPVMDLVDKSEKNRFKGKGTGELSALQDAMYLIKRSGATDADFRAVGAEYELSKKPVTVTTITARCKELGWSVESAVGGVSKTTKAVSVTLEVDLPDIDDFEEGADGVDAWEGGFWDASDPKSLTAHLQIEYEDGEGNKTTRSVQVTRFDESLYGGTLIGYCELRRATRTFRFDRIAQCIDLETGECIEDPKAFLIEKYEQSPGRSVDLLVDEYWDVLKVLYYVAKADGQYRKDEKEVIAGYIRTLLRDDRITPSMIDKVLRDLEVPSIQGFKGAFGRVINAGQIDPAALMNCCQEIVDTQKTVHPAEQEALDYMTKRWAKTGVPA